MKVFSSLLEWREYRKGLKGAVGFVPTMGALHAGHAELLRSMQREPGLEARVLSIFVNPTQFGPKEDLGTYPRTLQEDLKLAEECGVTAVVTPRAEEVYPSGYSTFVEETVLSQGLCGAFRPGHFRGVATVVLKLFNLVQPQVSWFGLKDGQQFYVIQRMVRDLDLDIEVRGVETVREEDGLAMSSRNRYLSSEERVIAPSFYRELQAFAEKIRTQNVWSQASRNDTLFSLESLGFKMQYLECREVPSLRSLDEGEKLVRSTSEQGWRLFGAGYLGKTRMIDNIKV